MIVVGENFLFATLHQRGGLQTEKISRNFKEKSRKTKIFVVQFHVRFA